MKIIITGTGRSGTSRVAKALHDIGFPMGENFVKANRRNPEGYFEDIEVVQVNKEYLNKDIDNKTWKAKLDQKIVAKDPRFADLVDDMLELYPHVLWIICERNELNTIASMKKTMPVEEAKQTFARRTANLKKVKNCIRIKI